ncbi:hypothetical protein OsJ_13682 [Oryza sativa Japonica Group]|uniref:DUF4220 domain-containing protein n=1 Tax=Oryza sativa subsp. japonica TaxID=39947 RepID=B9FDI2_ORYSJ|nr:hypothetical protein OsJ_13682 [Oryza sativa Japonica Group]
MPWKTALSFRQRVNVLLLQPIGKPDNDQILLVAHGNLHVTKGAFIDNLQYEHDAEEQEILPKTWDENRTLYKVVEMELSLMYDILYTKAAMVHTWGGYAIRVAFPFTGATAFLLFWFHSEDDVSKHLFESIWKSLKLAYPPTVPIDKAKATLPPAPFPPQHPGRADPAEMMPPTKQIVRQRELEDADLNFSPACQESILIWHIATDVFLLCSHQYSSLSKEVQAIKLLSDYMVFLVAVRPNMVPGLKLRSLYVAVGYALTNDDEILPKEGYHCNLTEKKEKLANRLVEMEQKPSSKNAPRSKWRPGVSGHVLVQARKGKYSLRQEYNSLRRNEFRARAAKSYRPEPIYPA